MPKLKFNLEEELDYKINVMDVTICRKQNNLTVDIYRKSTTTDVMIPKGSFHPSEDKVAAIRYFHNIIKAYKFSPDKILKGHNKI
jgi:hypothetical protein